MPRYVLVARDTGEWEASTNKMSPAEMQAILDEYNGWSTRVAGRGKLKDGFKLRDGQGRVLKGSGPQLEVTDGPHSASKEILGGVWLIEADSYEEVVKLASDNPHLRFGSLEVREIEEME